jgi:hypothetical protein
MTCRHETGSFGFWQFFGVFQKIHLTTGQGASAAAMPLRRGAAVIALSPPRDWRARLEQWAETADLVPDLGRDIGSATWWRGLFTCISLCALALLLTPGISRIPGVALPPLGAPQLDQYRSQMVGALAFGANSGLRMGPTDAVSPLAETPERPRIELDAALGTGASFAHTLSRSGVSAADAAAVLALIGEAVRPDSIAAGTRLRMVLGRRPNRQVPRPLERLAVRARLDLAIEIERVAGALAMTRIPIAVDDTPLRIRGKVGAGLYRAARAAGADPGTIQAFLKVLSTRLDIGTDLHADDEFDMILAHRQAATGETETGQLLYAGLSRARGKDVDMLKWTEGGREQWFEASGVGERRGILAQPVSGGRISSSYGERTHPILGYKRMHAGIDIAASYGSPIYAVSDGTVAFAGWHGGHGNYVKLDHAAGLGTGYGHMSRMAVKAGQRVKRGQVIGYVGSTGLSTGPHLHYELFRNGASVNPNSIKFTQVAQLAGKALASFKARLSELKRLPAGLKKSPAPTESATASTAGGIGASRPAAAR